MVIIEKCSFFKL